MPYATSLKYASPELFHNQELSCLLCFLYCYVLLDKENHSIAEKAFQHSI